MSPYQKIQMLHFSVTLFLTDELFELGTIHTNLHTQPYRAQNAMYLKKEIKQIFTLLLLIGITLFLYKNQ